MLWQMVSFYFLAKYCKDKSTASVLSPEVYAEKTKKLTLNF